MSKSASRRHFLRSTAGAAMVGLGDLSFLSALKPISADEAKLNPKLVRLHADLEPLVRLLEETPREKLIEEVAVRVKRGLEYQQLLAALLLAGVRNIQPRPVGFKFHAVLVVNSAHLASIASPAAHRWLPIFWALDNFKSSQAQNIREGGWTLGPIDESSVPSSGKAKQALSAALDAWDVPATDLASAAFARIAKPEEAFELFCRYGARDFRDIGHKAIFVANSWRTLQRIGWQHAEPVLRSLAYALLEHREAQAPHQIDAAADRPWRRNLELAKRIRTDWQGGAPSESAAREMLTTLREGSDEDTAAKVVELLNRGAAPQSLWDAIMNAAGELLMRQPGIVALHSVTTSNALRFAYATTTSDDSKRMMLLQNAAFIPLYRAALPARGAVKETRIDQLEPLPLQANGSNAVEEILADVSGDRATAARKMLAYLKDHPQPKELMDAARLLVFTKGTDSHDYKFSAAVLEDYGNVSSAWRARYLAASAFYLKGSGAPDNKLVQRIRAALG